MFDTTHDNEHYCCTRKRRKVTGNGWSELPPELLELILGKLPTFVDIHRFRSVCSSWSYATKCYISNPHCSSTLLQTPWLMVPSGQEDDGNSHCFYSIADKKVYTIKDLFKPFDHDSLFQACHQKPLTLLPFNCNCGGIGYIIRRSHICVGTAYGWLVVWTKKAILHLLNPISQHKIELPSMTTLPPTGTLFDFNWYVSSIYKAVVSSDPSNNKNFFIVVMYTIPGRHVRHGLAYHKHGDNTWTHLGSSNEAYRDMSFHNNHLFVGFYCKMEVWDFGTAAYPIKTMDFGISSEEDEAVYEFLGKVRRWRLVESFGEFLRVEQLNDYTSECGSQFNIFKLNFTSKKWETMECLRDRALLLGNNRSIMSISTRDFPEFEENSIYFINEYAKPDKYGMLDNVLVYSLEKNTVKSCFKYRSNSGEDQPTFWIVLNPST